MVKSLADVKEKAASLPRHCETRLGNLSHFLNVLIAKFWFLVVFVLPVALYVNRACSLFSKADKLGRSYLAVRLVLRLTTVHLFLDLV